MAEQTKQNIVVAIRFQHLGKLYHFISSEDHDLKVGDYVIVTTSRGRELAEVVVVEDNPKPKREITLKPIDRRATPQDLVMGRLWQHREMEALINCREKAAELN